MSILLPSDISYRQLALTELGKIVTGKTPRTSHSEYYGGETPFLTPSDDMNVKHVTQTQKTLSDAGVQSVKTCLLPARAIAVSCIGSNLGRVVITTRPTVTNQQFNALILDEEQYDVDYVYYALTALEPTLRRLSQGSTAVPIVNKSSFAAQTIPVPSLAHQKRIAAILCAFDEKIFLNRQLIANLQTRAMQLYKHWFIDFEFPNPEGLPYKSSGGKLKKSPRGAIPTGWKQGQFDDIADVISGGTPATKNPDYWGGDIPFFSTKDAPDTPYVVRTDKHITELGLQRCRSKLFPAGTIFLTARGTVGKLAIAGAAMAMNQSCYAIQGYKRYKQVYVYHVVKCLVTALQNKANGVVYDAINANDLNHERINLPPDSLVKKYVCTVEPLYDMIRNHEHQSLLLQQQLKELRAYLMPF